MIEVQKVSLQIKKAKILENVDFTCQKGADLWCRG